MLAQTCKNMCHFLKSVWLLLKPAVAVTLSKIQQTVQADA